MAGRTQKIGFAYYKPATAADFFHFFSAAFDLLIVGGILRDFNKYRKWLIFPPTLVLEYDKAASIESVF